MDAGDTAISVSGLRKSYGDREIIHGVSFDVAAGECFGLLGHNGAGKTTTIEILEGYLRRDAGTVSVLGSDPADPDAGWRSRIGIVLQDMDVFPTLTVTETMRMFADLYPTRAGSTRRSTWSTSVGSLRPGSAPCPVARSGASTSRSASSATPSCCFSTSRPPASTPQHGRDSWTMIEGLKELGGTIVLTTHYMDEAQTLADRLVILDDGVVAAEGTFGELLERHGATTEHLVPTPGRSTRVGAAV